MTPLAALIRDEISRDGPIPFRRFMELCLTHPQYGYYRRERDPFGKEGDFYTAEQIQPVFGLLMASRVKALFEEMGSPDEFTVVELGAGRGEMAGFFSPWQYVPVDLGRDAMPGSFTGVIFANEFFDALPVHVAIRRGEGYREMYVDAGSQDGFQLVEGGAVSEEVAEYLGRYLVPAEEGALVEVNLEALRWLERIAASLEDGYVLTIDYGYTRAETVRFPQGTLMSYRRHQASGHVLADPGERDITAHVPFTALQEHGKACGLETVRFERLAQTILEVGEAAMANVLEAETEAERVRRRLQLKVLMFGMGESFRTLLQRKSG